MCVFSFIFVFVFVIVGFFFVGVFDGSLFGIGIF